MPLIFDNLCRITIFSQNQAVFFMGCKSDEISESQNSDVAFKVALELYRPTGKTEFSSTARKRTNSVSEVRKQCLFA